MQLMSLVIITLLIYNVNSSWIGSFPAISSLQQQALQYSGYRNADSFRDNSFGNNLNRLGGNLNSSIFGQSSQMGHSAHLLIDGQNPFGITSGPGRHDPPLILPVSDEPDPLSPQSSAIRNCLWNIYKSKDMKVFWAAKYPRDVETYSKKGLGACGIPESAYNIVSVVKQFFAFFVQDFLYYDWEIERACVEIYRVLRYQHFNQRDAGQLKQAVQQALTNGDLDKWIKGYIHDMYWPIGPHRLPALAFKLRQIMETILDDPWLVFRWEFDKAASTYHRSRYKINFQDYNRNKQDYANSQIDSPEYYSPMFNFKGSSVGSTDFWHRMPNDAEKCLNNHGNRELLQKYMNESISMAMARACVCASTCNPNNSIDYVLAMAYKMVATLQGY